jgi:2-polyprenyl-3-methyl-5-hydroxy-6-metoxy-1,4-benzoquinol methylase
MNKVIRLSEFDDTNEFPSQWYELADENHFWCQWRFQVFLNLIKKLKIEKQQLKVLDIGCGNGLVRLQIEKYTNWISDGIDIDYDALQSNVNLLGNTYLYDIQEKIIDFKNKYDIILLFDVLEHIHDKIEFLDAVLFHLKQDGLLIINVPAFEFLRSKYDEAHGHMYRYTKKRLINDLHSSNTKIVYFTYWGAILIPLLILRKIMYFIYKPVNISRSGFWPPLKVINRFFIILMKMETSAFKQLSFGTSLLAFVKKPI